MPFLVGGFAAMVALTAGILAHVDPLSSLWRAGVALMLGWIGTSVWNVLTSNGRSPIEASEMSEASPGEPGTS